MPEGVADRRDADRAPAFVIGNNGVRQAGASRVSLSGRYDHGL